MRQVRILETCTGSVDGVNRRTYEAGSIHTASHPQQNRAFEDFVRTGKAEWYDPATPEKQTKVFTPKRRK